MTPEAVRHAGRPNQVGNLGTQAAVDKIVRGQSSMVTEWNAVPSTMLPMAAERHMVGVTTTIPP